MFDMLLALQAAKDYHARKHSAEPKPQPKKESIPPEKPDSGKPPQDVFARQKPESSLPTEAKNARSAHLDGFMSLLNDFSNPFN